MSKSKAKDGSKVRVVMARPQDQSDEELERLARKIAAKLKGEDSDEEE